MYSFAISEGTPAAMFLPEALRGLRTQLIPRRTREKLSHIPSPTTTPPHTFHGSNRQKLSSSSLFPFLHYALSSMSTQLFPLMRMFTIPPTWSVATLPLLFLFWTAYRDLSCALVAVPSLHPYVTSQSSTTCTTVLSYLYNLFSYYQVLIPLFHFRQSVPCAIYPLYHNTSRDSSSELSGASTVSSNQERLSHPMFPQWSKTEVGELNPPLFVTICPTVPTHSLILPSNKAFSSSQFSAHEFHQTIHTTSGFRSSPVDLDRSTTGLRMRVWGH